MIPDEYFHQDDVALTQDELNEVITEINNKIESQQTAMVTTSSSVEYDRAKGMRNGLKRAKKIIDGWSK